MTARRHGGAVSWCNDQDHAKARPLHQQLLKKASPNRGPSHAWATSHKRALAAGGEAVKKNLPLTGSREEPERAWMMPLTGILEHAVPGRVPVHGGRRQHLKVFVIRLHFGGVNAVIVVGNGADTASRAPHRSFSRRAHLNTCTRGGRGRVGGSQTRLNSVAAESRRQNCVTVDLLPYPQPVRHKTGDAGPREGRARVLGPTAAGFQRG